MKIHEYQAKDVLKAYGVPISGGVVVEDVADAERALDTLEKEFGATRFVVKAQIHAGGRGKGGGVKLAKTRADAMEHVRAIMGMTLVTHQTGPEGQLVRKVFITDVEAIKSEYYVAITLDRTTGRDVFMVSSEGGVEIEEVAKNTPEKIVKETVVPGLGLRPFQARNLAMALGLPKTTFKQAMTMFGKLYKAYVEYNCSILEINPLVLTDDDDLIALDAKINFDDSALYLHEDVVAMRDRYEEDPAEVEASEFNLNYIKLEGNVGCMVNGAGLAMATMDIIKQFGGAPANFLDVGGGANVNTVKNGFKIILSDESVKSVLINIFGGIVRCDRIANGIIEAVRELDLTVPVVVRLAGTNADQAKEILADSGVAIISADSFEDAARKAVDAAGQAKN